MNEDVGYEEFDRRRPGFFSRLFGTYQREVISAKLMFDAEYYYINLSIKKYRIFSPDWYMTTTTYKVKVTYSTSTRLETWKTGQKDAALYRLQNVRQAVKFITY